MNCSTLFLTLGLCLLSPSDYSGAPATTEAALTERLTLAWRALENFSFHCSSVQSEAASATTTIGLQTFDFSFGPEGKRSLQYYLDGKITYDFRENGKQHFMIRYLDIQQGERAKKVDRIQVRAQTDDSSHYSGMLPPPLWLIMPGGLPLHKHVEIGVVSELPLDPRDGTPGFQKELVRVDSKDRNKPIIIFLDKAHSFRPVKVELMGGSDIVATNYVKKEGHWFPCDGTFNWKGKGKWKWHVDSIRVNKLIGDAIFNPPAVTQGTIIRDFAKERTTIVGGVKARERLMTEADISITSPPRMQLNANASDKSPGILLLGLLIVSLAIGGSPVVVRRLRNRRRSNQSA